MRLAPLLFVLTAALLPGCANEGVIVNKDSVPLPFYGSLGVDGSYKLALRDSTGAVHSQLVTPEVFEGYAQGQYFNDQQPGPAQDATAPEMEGPVMPPTIVDRKPGGTAAGNGSRVARKSSGPQRAHTLARVNHAPAAPRNTVAQKSPAAPATAPSTEQGPVATAHLSVPISTAATVHAILAHPVKSEPSPTASSDQVRPSHVTAAPAKPKTGTSAASAKNSSTKRVVKRKANAAPKKKAVGSARSKPAWMGSPVTLAPANR